MRMGENVTHTAFCLEKLGIHRTLPLGMQGGRQVDNRMQVVGSEVTNKTEPIQRSDQGKHFW
jgi:hypothetical protein